MRLRAWSWKFAELSTLGGTVELWAVIALEGYFGISTSALPRFRDR